MEMMNIALPESLKDFVRDRVAEGGYAGESEYVRELIRADQQRQEAAVRIDARLLEGVDSGEPIVIAEGYWEEKKRRLAARPGEAIERR